MASPIPSSLLSLLEARDDMASEQAWSGFLDDFSKLILHTARRASSSHDEVMDRYSYVLERLRDDEFHRLKGFSQNGAGKFSTWLVVVVRRLCVDHHRQRYGRPQSDRPMEEDPEMIARRNLANMVSVEVDLDRIEDDRSAAPDAAVLAEERRAQLADAIAELPVNDQLLLTLRFVDGHPQERVAKMLGLPSRFHVYRRLKILLASLRKRLEGIG